ncbi:MAG: calcium/sodium antiporter [Desulfuromonadales bacterium]|nr:calcium/sodium antiporter [Desulfuromonadales bacterium]
MLIAVFLTVAGLLLLYYGAEALVTGSSRLALDFGVRPLIVGLTVVAFATSMPELMVSLFAAIKGSDSIAAGNIVGSNIANIALILGVAALLHPLDVARSTLSREIPMMIFASLLVYLFAWDGILGFGNGFILFAGLLLFIGYCVATARTTTDFTTETVREQVSGIAGDRRRNLWLVLFGIVGLGAGAEMMVRGAVIIAAWFGVPEVIIGLSIVALGTSLPELAASLMSAWKGEMDISVGNVIGSNIFNVLFVLGICPMVRPLAIESRVLLVDFPVMLGFCLLLVVLLLAGKPRRRLGRYRGGLLLGAYSLFIASLFF